MNNNKYYCEICNNYHELEKHILPVKDLDLRVFKLLQGARADTRFWRDQGHLWQGKYMMVKHENNKLRRKLYHRNKQAKGQNDDTNKQPG